MNTTLPSRDHPAVVDETSTAAYRVQLLSGASALRLAEPIGQCGGGMTRPACEDAAWLRVAEQGLAHQPYLVIAQRGEAVVGRLAMALVSSRLFGRFLVSLPYVNSGGVSASEPECIPLLVERAAALADELNVRYLELRHETKVDHSAFNFELGSKVHLRLPLPPTAEDLWNQLKAKVRNQVRKAGDYQLEARFGRHECLPDFYRVFARNMRDLGTPVFGKRLFAAILDEFPEQAELCVVTRQGRPLAAGILVHGAASTEIPSASSLREFNSMNANMFMYWRLLERAIERGQRLFDFGRSTVDSNTFRFKKQWGAEPHPAVWQYYVRSGDVASMRPDSARNQRLIRIWQRLPVWLTRLAGPAIVRGIP